MKVQLLKGAVAGVVGVLAAAGIAAAADVNVGVDIATPNVRVRAGTAPPPVTVVERERVIIHERDVHHHDNGKHKGHYKKHKKHKKHKH
jgi:hypothetical protein